MAGNGTKWKQRTAAGIVLAGLAIGAIGLPAKEPVASKQADAPVPPANMQEALSKIVSVDWTDVPFSEIAQRLSDLSGLPVVLDHSSLTEMSLTESQTVSCQLKGVPLASALRHVLRPFDLGYVPKEGVVLITTSERASNELVVRVYDVLDLLKTEKGSDIDALDYDSLIEMITTIIDPTFWSEVGGPATIARGAAFGCLTISQSRTVHDQITQLLAALRLARTNGGNKNYAPITVGDSQITRLNASLKDALGNRQPLVLDKAPLVEVAARLRTQTGLNVLVDQLALENAGIPLNLPLTARSPAISLRSALQMLLEPNHLKAVIRDGALVITSYEVAQYDLVNSVYPIEDLLLREIEEDALMDSQPAMAGASFGCITRRGDQVIEVITSAVAADTWGNVGGPGSIVAVPAGKCLVVRQVPEVHELMEAWLRDVRKTLAEREKAGVVMPKVSTDPTIQVFEQSIEKGSPISYEERRDKATEAINLIRITTAPDHWGFPERYIISVGSCIVVRHEPAQLRKIAKMLTLLGFFSQSRAPDRTGAAGAAAPGSPAGGGFFNRRN
jgi:hypothetical protein